MTNHIFCTVAVVGGGPAGLAAACAAAKAGAEKVVVVERDAFPGGILRQCIHPGFGLSLFKEELTGPEYAARFIEEAGHFNIEFLTDSMALEAGNGRVLCVNPHNGMTEITAKSLVLSMGCRERTRGNLRIPGTRPAGIYTAGSAQKLINRQNLMVGKKIVILGSGDIGMIMARRLTLEGAKIEAVVEILPYLAGLTRNRVQCLDDFGIKLLLSHTVTEIHGEGRVKGVKIARVDGERRPIPGIEEEIECDTLLLSVGLIPENELTRSASILMDPITNGPVVNQFMQTSDESVFACGNVLHVNDLVDNVSCESARAGMFAARHSTGGLTIPYGEVHCRPGNLIRYVCPQKLVLADDERNIALYFRLTKPVKAVRFSILQNGATLVSRKARRGTPGEMEHLDVPLCKLRPGELTLEACEEE